MEIPGFFKNMVVKSITEIWPPCPFSTFLYFFVVPYIPLLLPGKWHHIYDVWFTSFVKYVFQSGDDVFQRRINLRWTQNGMFPCCFRSSFNTHTHTHTHSLLSLSPLFPRVFVLVFRGGLGFAHTSQWTSRSLFVVCARVLVLPLFPPVQAPFGMGFQNRYVFITNHSTYKTSFFLITYTYKQQRQQ